jgi:hypothetical protein
VSLRQQRSACSSELHQRHQPRTDREGVSQLRGRNSRIGRSEAQRDVCSSISPPGPRCRNGAHNSESDAGFDKGRQPPRMPLRRLRPALERCAWCQRLQAVGRHALSTRSADGLAPKCMSSQQFLNLSDLSGSAGIWMLTIIWDELLLGRKVAYRLSETGCSQSGS